MIPVVRLNGTSDLPWENIAVRGELGETFSSLMALFVDVQFYDYTKSWRRAAQHALGNMPANYHLTFSRSECNDDQALSVLGRGGNAAVVFSTRKGEALPATWNGYPVIDGDTSDLRFTDAGSAEANSFRPYAGGFVVGLRAKGKARRDASGFVVAV